MTAPTPRRYEQKARAAQQEETKLRITLAAMEMHGSVGPSKTSISAVAEAAGVQRATLYRYFPDDEALFAACSAHWMAENPPPNIAAWAEIENPAERSEIALAEMYAYYSRNESMFANLHRDETLHPAIPPLFAAFRALLDYAGETLMAGRELKGRNVAKTRGAAMHAVSFNTWRSLHENGLKRSEAAKMMADLIENACRT